MVITHILISQFSYFPRHVVGTRIKMEWRQNGHSPAPYVAFQSSYDFNSWKQYYQLLITNYQPQVQFPIWNLICVHGAALPINVSSIGVTQIFYTWVTKKHSLNRYRIRLRKIGKEPHHALSEIIHCKMWMLENAAVHTPPQSSQDTDRRRTSQEAAQRLTRCAGAACPCTAAVKAGAAVTFNIQPTSPPTSTIKSASGRPLRNARPPNRLNLWACRRRVWGGTCGGAPFSVSTFPKPWPGWQMENCQCAFLPQGMVGAEHIDSSNVSSFDKN
jgi:hypothetical protein